MSDMKCPFCQRELEQITTSNPLGLGRIEMAVCKKCMDKGVLHIMPIWDWQELIRTRKALEIAKDALNTIKGKHDPRCAVYYIDEKIAYDALEQIIALEQKEVK